MNDLLSDEVAGGESYVVRIYRRARLPQKGTAATLAGIVEDVATGEQHSFSCVNGLWAILCGPSTLKLRRRTNNPRR